MVFVENRSWVLRTLPEGAMLGRGDKNLDLTDLEHHGIFKCLDIVHGLQGRRKLLYMACSHPAESFPAFPELDALGNSPTWVLTELQGLLLSLSLSPYSKLRTIGPWSSLLPPPPPF